MNIMLAEARRPCLAILLATAGLSLGTAAGAAEAAGEAHDHGDARLGTVEFGVGCNEAVREDFNRAMALYHSFAWSAAADAFAAVAEADPTCGIVGALSLCADNQAEACIEALQEAASREDATEKHVVTPGPILPARELLAEIRLEQGRPDEALAEHEAVPDKEPNRYRAIAGALAAAEQGGNTERALVHAADLIQQAADADTERASLAQARAIASDD